MAEKLKAGGYQCEFVDGVPEEFVCKSCKLVAREAALTSCCGEHFCHGCISSDIETKQQCPVDFCAKKDVKIFPHNGYRRKIQALLVHCTMKERDCEWVGKLEHLDAHIDGECQHVSVECPSKCDQKIQKCNVAIHLQEDCPKREFMCCHCNFKATFEIVSEQHWPVCSYLPVRCPNECGVTGEREIMEYHIKQICPLEEIECDLNYAGCQGKFLRQDQEVYMERNTQKHLSLLAAATLRISRECDLKLRDKDDEMKVLLREKDQQIKAMEEKFQEELQERDQRIKATATELTVLKKQLSKLDTKFNIAADTLPYSFTIANFKRLKREGTAWTSDYFYTHPRGYQCYIAVWLNGLGQGRGTHVTVDLYSVPGEFDFSLLWPANATITLELLNQHRDQDHRSVTREFVWERPGMFSDFSYTFIPHVGLDWNARQQTQYLKDNCLRFRITKIETTIV